MAMREALKWMGVIALAAAFFNALQGNFVAMLGDLGFIVWCAFCDRAFLSSGS